MENRINASVPTSLDIDPREERDEAVASPPLTDIDEHDDDGTLYPNPEAYAKENEYPKLKEDDTIVMSLSDE